MRFWKRIAAASAVATAASVLGLLLVLLPASGADAIDQEVSSGPTGWVVLQDFSESRSQTFTPAYPGLTSVELYLRTDSGSPTANDRFVTLDIYRSSDFLSVASVTVKVPQNFVGGWVPFDFQTVTIATSPQQYILDVYVDDAADQLAWGFDSASTYAGGQAFLFNTAQTYDFMFKTYLEDITGPVITPNLSVPTRPSNWYNTDVGLTWTVTDPDSSVTSMTGCLTQSIVADQAITTYSCSATSTGGPTGPVDVKIGRDTVKPVITYTRLPAANANGWNNSNVTVTFSCTDDRSGIATDTASGPQVVSTEGVNQSVTSPGTCVDEAGNVADPVTVTGINIDKTAPTIMAAATSAPNGAGWYKTDVTVHFTCADSGGSGIALGACPPDQLLSSEGAAVSSTAQTVTDLAGNTSASSNVVTVKIDKTAPIVTASATTAPNGNGWYNSNVTVQFTCTETLSGLPSGCPANQILSSEGTGIASTAQTVTDAAGNTSAPSNVVTVKIDTTPPTISAAATTAPNGAGWYNTNVTVHFTCADALSGIDTCPSDQLLNSEGPAVSSTAQQATDLAGNTSAISNVVTVKIDKTAPTVSLVPSPLAPNANGWYKTDVTVDTQGTDSGSGLTDANCTPDQLVGETPLAGLNVVGSCTDVAGNVGNAGPLNIKVDKTAPTTTLNVVGTLGSNGWYTSNVTVTPVGNDGLSGIDTCQAPQLLNTETTGTLVTLSCTDKAGNTTSASTTIKIDLSAPSASMTVILGTVGLNGWYRSPVLVAATGTDSISGPVDCTPALQNLGSETAGTTLFATCTNQAGISAPPASITIKIDWTAPTVTLTTSPASPDGDNGWFISPVTVDTQGTDALSGQLDANCTSNQTFAANTAGTTVNGSCTDNAGNSAGNSIEIKIDLTDPVPTMLITSGTLGLNNWYTTDVTVDTTGTDDISGPVVCTPPTETHSLETASYWFESTCTNQAGLDKTVKKEVKIDKTPPDVDIVFLNGAPNANGWSKDNVVVQANAVDLMSGPAVCTWTPGQVVNTETAGTLLTVTCENQAGLKTIKSVLVKLDLSDPVADIIVVDGTEGANGWYTSTVVAEAFGSDDMSGPVTCVPQLQSQTTETDGVDLAADCTNLADRTTHVSVHVKVDKTAPTNVKLAVTAGTLGDNGWYKSDVTVSTTSDAETI
ncbi:MAG: hypothetical protein K1X87_10120, partial [Dehalococcoidia bacterium]|nr:hypothetical protein [Dehalococcoidia bacterium]